MLDYSQLWPIIGLPVARSLAGWLENAFEDGQISKIEWKLLGSTVIRVGMIGAATFVGLNGIGIDVSAFGASASAVLMDFIMNSIKRKA